MAEIRTLRVKLDQFGAERGELHEYHDRDGDNGQITAATTETLIYTNADGKDFWLLGMNIYTTETTARTVTISDGNGTTYTPRGYVGAPTLANIIANPTIAQLDLSKSFGEKFTNSIYAQVDALTGSKVIDITVCVMVDPGLEE